MRSVPLALIDANPANVREDLGELGELARSIRSQGLLQPVLLAPSGKGRDRFVLLDGHRRRAAASLAGLEKLPALITDRAGTKDEVVATMLAASMHRQLAPMEQARAFRALRQAGVSIDEIAATTGFSSTTIRRRLDWMLLPESVQEMVGKGEVSRGQADDLARQVKTRRSGTTSTGRRAGCHLNSAHRLADVVREKCSHGQTRALLGQVGCSRCWEAAIREDERAGHDIDEQAVSQAVDGDLRIARALNPREREEAVRALTERGLSTSQIAAQLGLAARHVTRLRSAGKVGLSA